MHSDPPEYLIVIGAQKAATTSIYAYLSTHPHISSPPKKEVSYFSHHYDQTMNWYQNLFTVNTDTRYLLDASPQYLHNVYAAPRIEKDLPSAKIVCILRDPISRAISNYRYNIARGLQDPRQSFEVAVRTERGETTYLKKGKYAQQLSRYKSFFDAGSVTLLDFDDLQKSPQKTTHELCRKLILDPNLLTCDFDKVSNKTVDIHGLGACAIYSAMSLKKFLGPGFDLLPLQLRLKLSALKKAIAHKSQSNSSEILLNSNTNEYLLEYFSRDVQMLRQNYKFRSAWTTRYVQSAD